MYVFEHMYMTHSGVHAAVDGWSWENNFWRSFFFHVGSGERENSVGFDSKCLHPLIHFYQPRT